MTVVVGAGPVGLLCALARADRGDAVTVIERDPVPPSVSAPRRGVMQFHHPHFFRAQISAVLREFAPAVWEAVLAAGGVPAVAPGMPPGISGLACRRSVFEHAFRQVAEADRRLTFRTGRATRITTERGRVTGLLVDGGRVPAELIFCCTGRGGTLGDEWRPAAEGGPCGYSYVSRMYRAISGDDPFPQPFPSGQLGPGYLTIVFPQDDATHSVLVIRATRDRELARIQDDVAFTTVAAMVPNVAPWTDPDRFTPITSVLKGGLLTNLYRRQVLAGAPSGLFFVGDAVSTTSPMAGRGGSIGLLQVAALMRLLDEHDPISARDAFEAWCEEEVRPWYEDHVQWDESLVRRWAGADLDIEGPLPSDVICEAASEDPAIAPLAAGFGAMTLKPSALRPMEERARAVLRTGWRPAVEGPSRDELVAAVS